jgi:uncharacterized membrane protein YhaH (DUF805 family)
MPRDWYWAYQIPLVILTIAVRVHVDGMEDVPDLWLGVLLFLMWPHFCLMCRRLQDCGWSGMYYLPIFLLSVFWFLVELDPSILGSDEDAIAENFALLWGLSSIARRIAGFLFCYALAGGSEAGTNAYGPEFGTLTADDIRNRDDRMRERLRTEHGQDRVSQRTSRVTRDTGRTTSYAVEKPAPVAAQPRVPARLQGGFGRR